ncbi:hypothetical protein QO011_008375 [Labrys wisconsinensis]|uniref:Uncharacterized protein n=1 Tax=Labrys wisconsinensis TaxID=425677 RepID=A0ABU0JM26_9HYPH|nr:hypothetical protein [Labrys wisconsinensis]
MGGIMAGPGGDRLIPVGPGNPLESLFNLALSRNSI